ncbi:hypothetical protein PFISCL1PPCAC_21191 [Pristionchus fissidentatus]|uniref:F-box domain-containing protein n=1 Tax=Pristionchus fissidentatus TaxID=1538716 RepID=A0AAV5WGM6_9BILA|nr:hypothetical protein PFISCL1PPCAC_21191 [Pristionchus fissidentatus]
MTISVSPHTDKQLHNEIVESCKRIKFYDLIISFPILDLPSQLSYKILSYMGEGELGICRQSVALDKILAEWSKDKRIENLSIELGPGESASSSRYNYISVPFRDMTY